MFELAACLGIAVEIGGVEMVSAAPPILGGIERKVRVADEGFTGNDIVGRYRYAH